MKKTGLALLFWGVSALAFSASPVYVTNAPSASLLSGPYTLVGGGSFVTFGGPTNFTPTAIMEAFHVLNWTSGGATFGLEGVLTTPGISSLQAASIPVQESRATLANGGNYFQPANPTIIGGANLWVLTPIGSGLGAGTTIQVWYYFTK